MESTLEKLGLQQHYKDKLSLERLLEIDKKTTADTPPKTNTDLVWYFLKKLMMVNVTARNVKCVSDSDSGNSSTEFNIRKLLSGLKTDMVNPLDITTAVFLCSDGFVQQELSLKMSMCQFAVPLLLPNCDTNQCTMMLWALRDIVKKYRPRSLCESKGFIEEQIIGSKIPMISFVRLGDCSLSKSKILNQLLNHQYHDTFVHRDMESGNCRRKISNGLTEMTWYLPCGNTNIDIFSEPVAVANLRGDIASCVTQFCFLRQTSAAVFVFFDNLDSECEQLLTNKSKAQMFLVCNPEKENFNIAALQKVGEKLKLTNSNFICKTEEMNDADFIRNLQKTMRSVVESSNMKMPLEKMADVAHEMGIQVDEDCEECQEAKKQADAITAEIHDTMEYKETQLPRQGKIWKELTDTEKEEFRLQKFGNKDIEDYKSELKIKKEGLRKEQNSYGISKEMTNFITAISSTSTDRSYFLKWMRMNLDNLSHEKLSRLREEYKEKSKVTNNEKELKRIDEELCNSSLGTEHFFREIGQIYEASVCLSETIQQLLQQQQEKQQQIQQQQIQPQLKQELQQIKQELQQLKQIQQPFFSEQIKALPKYCAQLLLDGFPLELVDGDASNIPLRWVSDVLAQLNELLGPNNRILVVTVLGVQSTGKSTLLNTMFGVQFAVSSGRCTRGAFMLLIRINEDVKQKLNCDFIMIIDTEGLKSQELAQLEDSYKHDNELGTLVVGLSDLTIINIAMENSAEMKDILQIVVHAFLRMKEVGRKPKCQFVHQNVSDVSAHEKNLRERKLLLEQLDEMTQAAAKMEKKENYKSFNDVMNYSPDTGNQYIPGLWNGSPPMAPVSAGYSEAVNELKKNILQSFENYGSSAHTVPEFCEWVRSLWTAVKHENFIFSFKNTLVADAYMHLCTQFNTWVWDFKKAMYSWVTNAETEITNFGTVPSQKSNLDKLITDLRNTSVTELSKWRTTLLTNLKTYFSKKDRHISLVEGYKQQFEISATSLIEETERSINNQLNVAADMKNGMAEVDKIKQNHSKVIEKRVLELIENCRKRNAEMTDQELDREFDLMWNKTLQELPYKKQKREDVFDDMSHKLRQDMDKKGSYACEVLSKEGLKECGRGPFKYSPEGWKQKAKTWFGDLFTKDKYKKKIQMSSATIIDDYKHYMTEKVKEKRNYHQTYCEKLLRIIDDGLNKTDLKGDSGFEVSLKKYICAKAARQFEKMQEDFLKANDPHECLNKNKETFRSDFKDVFNQRDQCQRKAQEFTEGCLRPAVEDYINRSLGPDIVSEMRGHQMFSLPVHLQSAVLTELIEKEDFNEYLRYTQQHETFVKDWILNKILFSDLSRISSFEKQHIKTCVALIKDAIIKANEKKHNKLKDFVQDICSGFANKLVISQDALHPFLITDIADNETFVFWLTKCVDEMAQSLETKFKKSSIKMKLQTLQMKPQDELFKVLIGCGKQCPFCKAPCEAGQYNHQQHFAHRHRPEGLGAYRWTKSSELVTDICTSLVISDKRFKCKATNGQWHPYKEYRDIYPDWDIGADSSLQASDYWKYVFTRFNSEFAKAHGAKPANIPATWKSISKEQAKQSAAKPL